MSLDNSLVNYTEDIYFTINDYVEDLLSAEIPIPKILHSKYYHGILNYECEYAGENILHMFEPEKLEQTIFSEIILNQIIEILKKARLKKLYFDPHPKNFVIQDNQISYVDFTPPWKKKYFTLRLSIANNNEKKILRNFFDCMHFDLLGYHLCADILKMNEKNYSFKKNIFKKLLSYEIVNENFEEFSYKVEEIIRKEKERELNNLFLL